MKKDVFTMTFAIFIEDDFTVVSLYYSCARDKCENVKCQNTGTVCTFLSAERHPDSQLISQFIWKTFQYFLFLSL